MGYLFLQLYGWFKSLFTEDYLYYLEGNPGGGLPSGLNQLISYGMMNVGISLVAVLIFYYVINHTRFNQWWHWLLVLICNGLIVFGISLGMSIQEVGAQIGIDAYSGDPIYLYSEMCVGFGISNLLLSVLFFLILSLGLKWWSRNCSMCPFKKF